MSNAVSKTSKASTVRPVETVFDRVAGLFSKIATDADLFRRRSILASVNAIGVLIAGTGTLLNEKGKPVSRESLFDSLNARLGAAHAVSKASLRRWGIVYDIHAARGIKPTEQSASAVYALTESGMTAAKKAVAANESPKTAAELVAVAVTELATVDRKIAADKAIAAAGLAENEGNPSSVAKAPYTLASFAASVRELSGKVGDADTAQVVKSLRAIATDLAAQAAKAKVSA